MAKAFEEYFEALDRLKRNQPIRVPKGSKISNDTASIEANRGKGSIKKSRALFADLIVAIDAVAANQATPYADQQLKIAKVRGQADKYRALYEEAIAREVSLLKENFGLKRELQRLGGAAVVQSR